MAKNLRVHSDKSLGNPAMSKQSDGYLNGYLCKQTFKLFLLLVSFSIINDDACM